MSVREMIVEYLSCNSGFISEGQLKHNLNIVGEEQTTSFYSELETLLEEGCLFFDEKRGYELFPEHQGYAYGKIEIKNEGYGFVEVADGNVIYIGEDNLNGALNEDVVIVSNITFGRKGDYRGSVYKVVKRSSYEVIFEVIGSGYNAILKPYNPNDKVLVDINRNQFKNLVDGELVSVSVGCDKIGDKYIANINGVVGHRNDADLDLKLIYYKYNVPVDFSREALEEAQNLPTWVSDKEIKGRVDLRDKEIVTIDCVDTKDRDDAVYVERLSNGHYKLYVSISHISYYVKRDSSLYKEACSRRTSHYPIKTCNPMFPHKLSNGICSLDPNVDRLARTCEMEFDGSGNLVDYNIYLSVIRSRKAMNYDDANLVIEGYNIPGYLKYLEQLKLMVELNDLLDMKRRLRNCLEFDIDKIELSNSNNGFELASKGKFQRVIENFMLVTGHTVASHYSWLPFIYRIHESPSEDVVRNVIKILVKSGFDIPNYRNINAKTIKDIIDRVGNSEEGRIVRNILLHSMKRARYNVINIGHFALQYDIHSHFTSPIRRIADFRIHMLLDELDGFEYSENSIARLEKDLLEICRLLILRLFLRRLKKRL